MQGYINEQEQEDLILLLKKIDPSKEITPETKIRGTAICNFSKYDGGYQRIMDWAIKKIDELKPKKFDVEKMKKAIELFIEATGDDSKRDGLLESPERVARFYETVLNGYDIDPKKYLKIFNSDSEDMVVVEAPLYSFCEHHFALFSGKIVIAYIPNGKIIGLSKLIRIARVFAKRLQVQERLTRQVADFLEKNLSAQGVAVHIVAEHSCMSIRGVRTPGAKTRTTRLTGLFKTDPATRQEFMTYLRQII